MASASAALSLSFSGSPATMVRMSAGTRKRDFRNGAVGSAITNKVGPDIAKTRITCHTEGVPEYCTCGARLPEDALFCHKCGKPQRDDLIQQDQPADQPSPPPLLPPPVPTPRFPPIGFQNGPAVRIAVIYGFM